jgi:hypothetical protein
MAYLFVKSCNCNVWTIQGECVCSEVAETQKESRSNDKTTNSEKTHKAPVVAAAAVATAPASKPVVGLRRPPRLVRQRPGSATDFD